MTIVQETLYFLSRDDASGHVEYTCRSDDKTDMYNKENYNKGLIAVDKFWATPLIKMWRAFFYLLRKLYPNVELFK